MFEEFSSGYYLGRMYVEPYSGEEPVMQNEEYEAVSESVYEEENNPLVMKVGRQHFTVRGEAGIPSNTLALPEGFVDRKSVKNPPELKEVFLAKPEHATRILNLISETEV